MGPDFLHYFFFFVLRNGNKAESVGWYLNEDVSKSDRLNEARIHLVNVGHLIKFIMLTV